MLKIDRSFVRDIVHDVDDAAIVRAIIQMAGSLGISTIADGVEDQQTVIFLKRLGCNLTQGLLYSPVLNGADFELFYAQFDSAKAGKGSSINLF